MTDKQRALLVLERLKARYPTLDMHLTAHNPWELLVATVLAAQCTDERVNKVTPVLFKRWPDPAALAEATVLDVEEVVRSTGFYHSKAKHLIATAKMVLHDFNGVPPQTMEELIRLPGVARKTANVVLWGGYGINLGLAVDTHVKRIAARLGLTTHADPVRIEQDLMRLFPRDEWGGVNHRMVWFGRHVCDARTPLCAQCDMASFCPQEGVATPQKPSRKTSPKPAVSL
ncbi:MAG: endonuclease III [Bilophila sp.]